MPYQEKASVFEWMLLVPAAIVGFVGLMYMFVTEKIAGRPKSS